MHNTSLFDFPRRYLQHLLKSDPDYKQPLYIQLHASRSRETALMVKVRTTVNRQIALIKLQLCIAGKPTVRGVKSSSDGYRSTRIAQN